MKYSLNNSKVVYIDSLKGGDLFRRIDNTTVYIRINPSNEKVLQNNAISIDSGLVCYFSNEIMFYKVEPSSPLILIDSGVLINGCT